MTLSDGDVAGLARQVVDTIDPDLDIRIEPTDPVDPYRWGEARAWTVSVGESSSYLTAALSEEEAVAKLRKDLGAP
jgi:hypothetical protein